MRYGPAVILESLMLTVKKSCGFGLLALLAAIWLATPIAAQVTFVDRAPEFGIENEGFGRASAMIDLDGDGRLDLIASNAGMPNAFFRQTADGRFVDAVDRWQVPQDNRASWGVLVADFDNDGDPDIYFVNGAFFAAQFNQLLRNDIDTLGRFTDVTPLSGDGQVFGPSFGGAAVDYDRDGDLDIFLANTLDDFDGMGGSRVAYPMIRPLLEGGNLNLLRNDGDLVFTEVTAEAGLTTFGSYKHTGVGDVDNDGWPDLGAGNYSGPNVVFRNNGDGTFEEIAATLGVDSPDLNFGLMFEDFNNDGRMDIYLPKYQEFPDGPSELYLNLGDLNFVSVTPNAGLTGQTDMGHNVHDVDGDGFPDIYIGTGHPDFESNDKLFLMRPNGPDDMIAIDASEASGIVSNGPTRSHGHAFGDYDRDGDLDIWVNNGGPQVIPSTVEKNFFWENNGNGNAWLMLDIEGVLSNRSGVGARIRTTAGSGRDIHRHRAVGRGFGNSNEPAVHVGLGDETEIDQVEINWPSGIVQTLVGPQPGSRIKVFETGVIGPPMAEPGETYEIESYGPPNFEVVVFQGVGESEFPLPRFGGVARLQQPVSVVAIGALDGKGRGTVSVSVPDREPGERIFLQAWVRQPGASEGGILTNLLSPILE